MDLRVQLKQETNVVYFTCKGIAACIVKIKVVFFLYKFNININKVMHMPQFVVH